MNSLRHRNNSGPRNEQIWHASFASSLNTLTASCSRIRTASITWISRSAQSRFSPVHTGRVACVQMRAGPSRQDRRPVTQWCFAMGIRHFHHPQEGWPCSVDIQFPCSEQMYQAENLSVTSHCRNSVQAHRIRVFLEVGHQHGLLYFRG